MYTKAINTSRWNFVRWNMETFSSGMERSGNPLSWNSWWDRRSFGVPKGMAWLWTDIPWAQALVPESESNTDWPPVRFEQKKEKSEKLPEQVSRDHVDEKFSQLFSKIYEKSIAHFEDSLKNQEEPPISSERMNKIHEQAIALAGDFIRQYSVQIRALIDNDTLTKEQKKEQIRSWRVDFGTKKGVFDISYRKSEVGWDIDVDSMSSEWGAWVDTVMPSATEEAEADELWENYAKSKDEYGHELEEALHAQEMKDSMKIAEAEISTVGIVSMPQESSITSIDFSSADTGAFDVSEIPSDTRITISIPSENGTAESGYIYRTDNEVFMNIGGSILRFPEAKFTENIELIQSCMQTPLARRLLKMGDSAFDLFCQKVQKKYAASGIDVTQKENLIRLMLGELFTIAADGKDKFTQGKNTISSDFLRPNHSLSEMQHHLAQESNPEKDFMLTSLREHGVIDDAGNIRPMVLLNRV